MDKAAEEQRPVVGGIIDIANNQIIEVTRSPGGKTKQRLKVRDELVTDRKNPEYATFEFGTSGGDLSYVKRTFLQNASELLLCELDLYQAKYNHFSAKEDLTRHLKEFGLAKETASQVPVAFRSDPEKVSLLSELLEPEVYAREDRVDRCIKRISILSKKVDEINGRIAELTNESADPVPSMKTC